jgi:hypothetical protein
MATLPKTILGVLAVLTSLAAGCAAASAGPGQTPPAEINATETPGGVISITNPEVSPMSTVPTNKTDASSSEPGQVPGGLPSQDQGTPQVPPAAAPSAWQTFPDNSSHFTIAYPSTLTPQSLSAGELKGLEPLPTAAVYFRDQREASIPNAPPAFSIRVFSNDKEQGLEDWLIANKLLLKDAGWATQAYQGKNVSGIKVMTPTLMAPGWFVYIAHGGNIFQLTPLGTEAEQMLDTFKFTD